MGLFSKKTKLPPTPDKVGQEEKKTGIDLFGKKQIEDLTSENTRLQNIIDDIGAKEYSEVVSETSKVKEKLDLLKKELSTVQFEISESKKNLFDISEEVTLQDFGIYKPKYDCMNSDEYKYKINEVRTQQKNMIKNKTALNFYDQWVLDGSKSKGRAMNNDNMKMVLRAFNNECDSIIDKVKFNNIDKIKDQIFKSANAINKLNERNKISITHEYYGLKIKELELVHEYRVKKQEEKEAIREARAQEREQAKLQKEIEEARKKILKEQAHYQSAKEKYTKELLNADDSKKDEILEKIKEIENHLNEVDKNLQDIDYREANQRAGYVYIISNIGSFGENIYKIGMTRRLEPQDRIDELGDASVPFTFDVHAMIFSKDAPALENELHKAFDDRKVNMINGRKEFFHVTLDEIKEVVKKHHEQLIEIKEIPEAEQYRETILLRKQLNK